MKGDQLRMLSENLYLQQQLALQSRLLRNRFSWRTLWFCFGVLVGSVITIISNLLLFGDF